VTPYSDFNNYTFSIDVIPPGPGPNPQPDGGLEAWRIILIVIGSVLASGFVAYIIFLCYKKNKKESEENPLEAHLNDEEEEPSGRLGALNESVAYTESVRNTINPPTAETYPAIEQ
jgi:hypothetical protein